MVVEGVEPILVAAERDVSRPMLTEQLRDEIDLLAAEYEDTAGTRTFAPAWWGDTRAGRGLWTIRGELVPPRLHLGGDSGRERVRRLSSVCLVRRKERNRRISPVVLQAARTILSIELIHRQQLNRGDA